MDVRTELGCRRPGRHGTLGAVTYGRRHGWALAVGLALAACGGPEPADAGASPDAAVARDAASRDDAGLGRDAATADGGASMDAGANDAGPMTADAGPPDAGPPDAGRSDAGTDAGPDAGGGGATVFDVRVRADAFCADLFFEPASIAVPAGTSFTVRWINATGCTDIDIDMGGTVPIVIGLASGASYHDTVRAWCGSYTGTYVFRAYYSPSFPYTLDVDCSA